MLSGVLERTMGKHSSSRQASDAIEEASETVRERAAKVAVRDVSMHATDIGISRDQADLVQEAFRLGLLRDIRGARSKLNATGLEPETVSRLIEEIERH